MRPFFFPLSLRLLALGCTVGATALALAPGMAQAQSGKTAVVIGMVLEPPGLDPSAAPAAAIGEIVHLNVLEGLTKINMDGQISPLLAERWLRPRELWQQGRWWRLGGFLALAMRAAGWLRAAVPTGPACVWGSARWPPQALPQR